MSQVFELEGIRPTLPENGDYWIAPGTYVIGNVVLAEGTSVWFGTTIRGDNEIVNIETESNIQENSVLHTDIGFPIKIGTIDTRNCQIFDSGTSLSENGQLLTDGGRVLSIVCQDKDFDMVFDKAYKNLKEINFDGIYYREDIGHQVRKNFLKEI